MPPKKLLLLASFALAASVFAAQPSQPQQSPQPQVKVNVLNVCTPSAEEQKEISTALSHVPKQPLFSADFEVDRGRSTLSESPDFLKAGASTQMAADNATADWVRIRREFSVQSLFSTVQYSFSVDPKNMVETLVFRVRDPKDLMQLSIEDSASAVTSPTAMLSTSTPVSRIRLERFGKPSVALARCLASEGSPPPDQSAYEPIFQSATTVIANYRTLLAARDTVPNELAHIGRATKSKSKAPPKTESRKPATESK